MKIDRFVVLGIFFMFISCTLDKTNYEDEINTVVTEYDDFKEAVAISKDDYTLSIETLNGTFYKGYNEIRLKIVHNQTKNSIEASEVTFLPIMLSSGGTEASGPHRYRLEYQSAHGYYSGYAVFTDTTKGTMLGWKLYLSFTVNHQTYSVDQDITVQKQSNQNLNMASFVGNDGKQYYIALVAPQKPNVAENELVAGIYQYNPPTHPAGSFPDPSQFSYSEVNGYTLQLDPRMPEPSMGNHSSPNNRDLKQRSNGLYYGLVNYTMTGNWTLNLMMLDQNGKIIKGTLVPLDFTPGIPGAKSELYIDVAF